MNKTLIVGEINIKIYFILLLFLPLIVLSTDVIQVDIQTSEKEIYVNMPVNFTVTVSNNSNQPVTVYRPTTLLAMTNRERSLLFSYKYFTDEWREINFVYPWINDSMLYYATLKRSKYFMIVPPHKKIECNIYIGHYDYFNRKGSIFDKPGKYQLKIDYYPFGRSFYGMNEASDKTVFSKSFDVVVKDVSEKDKQCWRKLSEHPEWPLVYDVYGANLNAVGKAISSETVDFWKDLMMNYPDSVYSPLIKYQWFLMNMRRQSDELTRDELCSGLSKLVTTPTFVFREPASAYKKLLKNYKRFPYIIDFFAPPFVQPDAREIAAMRRQRMIQAAAIAMASVILLAGAFVGWHLWQRSRRKTAA